MTYLVSLGVSHAPGTDIALKGGSHPTWLWAPNAFCQVNPPMNFVLGPGRVLEGRTPQGQCSWLCSTALRPAEVGHTWHTPTEKNLGPAFYSFLAPVIRSMQSKNSPPSCHFKPAPPQGRPYKPLWQAHLPVEHPEVEPRLASFLSEL